MITIGHATADDAEEIARVHARADWETYSPIFLEKTRRRDLGGLRARWAAAVGDGDVALVARDGEKIIGFAHARADWLNALYLLANYHRQGIGSELLVMVAAELRARGVATAYFQVVADNRPAVAFYQDQGARAIGRKLESEEGDVWEDLIFELPTGRAETSDPNSPAAGPRAGRSS